MAGTIITSEIIALALGSNLGDRLASLRAACSAIAPFFTIQRRSPIYETPAAYVTDQPPYLNAALIGTSRLSPEDLLKAVKTTEQSIGRIESFRYGPRLIDIDLIFYGARIVERPDLVLPHPRLAEREFVLRPLAAIAGDWRHPATGLTIAAMLAQRPESTAQKIQDNL